MVSSTSFAALALSLLVSAQQALGVWMAEPKSSAVGTCHNITLTLKGVPPFTVSVFPGCDQDDQTDTPLSSHTTSSFNTTWVIKSKPGSSVQFGVTDSKKNSWFTEDYTVLDSGIDDCLKNFDTWRDPAGALPAAASASGTSATATKAAGNAAGTQTDAPSSSTPPVAGGALNGAFSSYAPRTEMAAFAAAVVFGAVTLF